MQREKSLLTVSLALMVGYLCQNICLYWVLTRFSSVLRKNGMKGGYL